MLSSILGFISTGALSLLGILLSLLPTVDISSLPLGIPSEVSNVLGMVNVFIPISDLIAIISWWALLIIVLNVFYIVKSVFESVKS